MNNMFVKLKDIADLTVGYVGNMTKEYIETGVPFFRSLNIKPFYIDKSDLLYISSEFNEKIKKSKLMTGDLVIVRTGQPGTCCVVPQEFDGCNCSDLVIVRLDKKLVNPYYLEAYINFMAQKQINNHQVGAIQKHFNVGSAKEMLVYLPDREKQEKIANIVRRINSKIELNNKINTELESMAKTLYDYWFLQFGFPNKEGKPYKSSGGKMVWNEELKREIPEGWEVENIFECMDVVYGVPLSTELFDTCKGTPVIRIRDIPNNTTSAFTTEEFDNKFLSKNKDLLIGMDGNFHMNFWATEGDCINQRIVRIRDKKEISVLQIFYEIRPYIKAKEQNVARSTVGHLSDQDLKALYILNSHDENIYKTFDKLLSLICKNKKENQELTSLRDFLLPLLMNGQVGFKE